MRYTTAQYHGTAEASGARIVHSCGFDSVPSDLGVLLLHERAQTDGAGDLEDTTLVVTGMKGGASGGTIASLQAQIKEVESDDELKRIVEDPYALSPDRDAEPDLGDESDLSGVEKDDDLDTWRGPFVMAPARVRGVGRGEPPLL